MLVSIIIPVHQTVPFLKECVASALAQTHTQIEVLLACNGGLTPEACERFLGVKDDRLQFILCDSGRDRARTHAMQHAQGTWLQFLDYDDVLYPKKIETQLQNHSSNTLLICGWKKFSKTLEEPYTFPFPHLFETTITTMPQLYEALSQGGFIATAAWLVPAQYAKDIVWEDVPNDDAVFLSELAQKELSLHLTPQSLVGVRVHSGNTSKSPSKKEFLKLLRGWRLIEKHLTKLPSAIRNRYLYTNYQYVLHRSKHLGRYQFFRVALCFVKLGLTTGKSFSTIFKDLKNA